MGLQDLTSEPSLVDIGHLTIDDLVNMFGREATRRGLEYMKSLDEADDEFRGAADPETMTEGYRKAGVRGDVEPVSEEWAKSLEQEGLGLDDDD